MSHLIWIYTILGILQIEAKSCGPDVCFNWKISYMKLTLVCKISHFQFNAYIEDPNGNIQANCFPPSDISTCHVRYKNMTIKLNQRTSEVTFTLRGVINTKINGNWTCRHGEKRGIAHVEVTVLTYHDNQRDGKSLQTIFENKCIYIVVFMSSSGFIVAITMTLVIMSFISRISYINDHILMRTAEVLFCSKGKDKIMQCFPKLKKIAFAVSTVLFFGFAVLIGSIDNKECSTKWLFVVLGLIIGFVFSLSCLSKDKVTVTLPLQMNDNTQGQGHTELTEEEEHLSRQVPEQLNIFNSSVEEEEIGHEVREDESCL